MLYALHMCPFVLKGANLRCEVFNKSLVIAIVKAVVPCRSSTLFA